MGKSYFLKLQSVAFALIGGILAILPKLAGAQWKPNPEDILEGGTVPPSGYGNALSSDLPGGSIYSIIESIMLWLLGILGFIAIIGFVISGILYLTAAGNESQAEKAKNALTYSIIGVIVALMGFVVIRAVDAWLYGGFYAIPLI